LSSEASAAARGATTRRPTPEEEDAPTPLFWPNRARGAVGTRAAEGTAARREVTCEGTDGCG
jgi:hypothetical protein